MKCIFSVIFILFSFQGFSQNQRINLTNLSEKNLEGAQLQERNLTNAKFNKSFLMKANFKNSTLVGSEFTNASLIDADLRGADLQNASFQNADLSGADLTGAKNLEKAILSYAQYTSETKGLSKEQKKDMIFVKPSCNKNIKVTHLKQRHIAQVKLLGVSVSRSYEQSPDVLESQFRILNKIGDYMIKGKEIVFFNEERTASNFVPDDRNRYKGFTGAARSFFSEGIPRNLENFSHEQKDFLYRVGAVNTLYFLGAINVIFKVISQRDIDLVEINRRGLLTQRLLKVVKGEDYFIHNFRERKLKEEVDMFLSAYKERYGRDYGGEVIIVYGGAHDLSQEFKNCSFQVEDYSS